MFGEAPQPVNENRKLLIMSGGVVVLIIALFTMNSGLGPGAGSSSSADKVEQVTDNISVPELDVATLATLVSDKTQDGRDIQEEEGREYLLKYVGRLAPAHYRALGAPSLSAEVSAEIAADPTDWRGKAVHMRGQILDMRAKARPNGESYFDGTLTLDDGSPAHFVVERLWRPDLIKGDSVWIDGVVMKVFRGQAGDELLEAPLVVGRDAARSYPALFTENVGPFTESELVNVVNDGVVNGVGTLPFLEKWKLMGRAAYSADEIDWDSVPVLNRELLTEYVNNGDVYRGTPVRLAAEGVALLNKSTNSAGENPARIERFTDGWITENSWQTLVGGIRFMGPFEAPYEQTDQTVVVGNGFFFKNHAFESSKLGLRVGPVLVMANMDVLPRPEEKIVGYLMYGVFAGSIGLGVFIFMLLRRDAKSSSEFQKRLSARKRRRPETEVAG
ncbi:MAG: hypothetical protein ACJAZ8_000660 [Planctomycetota bacterium]|jgi:hypothetical protein